MAELEPRCTSLVIIGTYEDGQTFATTFPEPESVGTEIVEGDGTGESMDLYPTSAVWTRGNIKINFSIVPGERGLIRVTTPIPGTS